jgi:four helix bundle protein
MLIFENLIAYQKSLLFTQSIYRQTNNWPQKETYALTNQIRRSATSIPLNIAEGSSRSRKDFNHFLDISRGSCFETIAILTIAKNLHYISDDIYKRYYSDIEELIKIIHGLKKSLSKSKS